MSSPQHEYDVLIMGAGMVGSALACGLSGQGLRIAIVDPVAVDRIQQNDSPRIRVSAVSYASEQILKNIGAWSLMDPERCCPYRFLAVNEMHAKKGLAAHLPDISRWARTEFGATELNLPHLGHIIENDLVQSALHELMESRSDISVFCPASIGRLYLSGETKGVEIDDGVSLSAPLVIGAEGANSVVRNQAGIPQYREQYAQQAFVCTVAYDGGQQDITWQSFTPQGPRAFLPLSRIADTSYASLVWYDSPETVSKLKSLEKEELILRIREGFPSSLPPIRDIVEKASFPLYKSHAKTYVKPGIALVGDAAHTINPLAGQGVNLGFMDAAVLAEVLVRAHYQDRDLSSLAVLHDYEHRRRKENATMMRAMDAFYYGFSNALLPARIVRNIGLGLANHSGLLKQFVLKQAVGLSTEAPRLAKVT